MARASTDDYRYCARGADSAHLPDGHFVNLVECLWAMTWMFVGAFHGGIPPEILLAKINAGREVSNYYITKWLNRG
jgi:hypothetical protein